jgi:hypothetical protein
VNAKWVSIVVGGAVLALTAFAFIAPDRGAIDAAVPVALATRLPLQVGDWRGKDFPLGPGELGPLAEKALNPTDYLFREYSNGTDRVLVYAMFWRQGRISVREMTGHTPDGCWVTNGATHAAPARAGVARIRGRTTAAGEFRFFHISGNHRSDVVWWHIWGEQLVSPVLAERDITAMVAEVWQWLVGHRAQRRDQWLVRIHVIDGDLQRALDSPPVKAFADVVPIIFEAKAR